MCLGARMLALEWKGRAFTEKVNSRCFCWFPAAKLSTNMASLSIQSHRYWKLYKGAWNVSTNNSETGGHNDLRFGQIVYMLAFYNISFSWLLTVDGFQFIFLCRVYFFIACRWKPRISLSMKRIVESRLNNLERKGKNRTRRKQVVLFIGAYIQIGLLLKSIHFQLCIQNKTLTLLVNSWITSYPNPHY